MAVTPVTMKTLVEGHLSLYGYGIMKYVIADWLEDDGFDGLFNDEDCGCGKSYDEIMPCGGEGCENCKPGFKIKLEDGSDGYGPERVT